MNKITIEGEVVKSSDPATGEMLDGYWVTFGPFDDAKIARDYLEAVALLSSPEPDQAKLLARDFPPVQRVVDDEGTVRYIAG